MLVALNGCKDYDAWMVEESYPVEAAFTLSVSSTSNVTRMAGDIVQANDNFRGLMDLRAIPFATAGQVTVDDHPKAFATDGIRADEYTKTSSSFYYFEGCSFMTGVSSFLIYARANTSTGSDGLPLDKAGNGSLTAHIPADSYPSGISFAPTVIYDADDLPAHGVFIADLLTTIANTSVSYAGKNYTWRAAADTKLRAFYQNFTGQGSQSTALLASSTANIQQYLSKLSEQITALSYPESTVESLLRAAILQAITAASDVMPANYPASINLPAGAAVVRWNGNAFEPQTTTTTLASISDIHRYAYPAELYYFANSRIKTSMESGHKARYSTASSWSEVLSQYEIDNGSVTQHTTGVAVKEPLQYAVGCLRVHLNNATSTTLTDADGEAVPIWGMLFPLTGIIVGSQRPVGFDFCPTSASDLETRFIYDANPVTTTGSQLYIGDNAGAASTNTLVLQTCDGEDVTLILEFQNNSSTAFRSINGMVYPGTRFYLVGSIKPSSSATNDFERRAFTKDYTTSIGVSIASLAKAYNTVPDILSPQLEVGIQLTPQWTLATPTMVPLN